ncbi:hypothetical protein BS17DRAFT_781352 [Gyrodon lividus]|nr:hypothetical protein BS17DRAFT_781352 [Gyrodon lividus]
MQALKTPARASVLEALDTKQMDLCRVFYITEILRIILDNLADNKRSLLCIATCSKAFLGPALDTLWEDMNSFDPFVPLLPKNVRQDWHLTYAPDSETVSCMQCSAEEWKVFDFYARRVRYLFCSGESMDRESAYQRLAFIRPSCAVFPHLKALQLSIMDPSPVPVTLRFPSSLRTLEIRYLPHVTFLAKPHQVELILRQAAEDVPLLENLEISGVYRPYPAGEPHRPLPFRALHTVNLAPVWEFRPGDIETFSRLLSTAPIRCLIVHIPVFFTMFVKPVDKTSIFPNVEVLTIVTADPRQAGDITSRINSPHLHTVTLSSISDNPDCLDHFITILAQRPVPIRSLKIKVGSVELPGNRASAYMKGFLQRLEPVVSAGLEKLTVEITMQNASRVRSSVWKLLDRWPTLERFECTLTDPVTGEFISVIQS